MAKKKKKQQGASEKNYARIFEYFSAPISKVNCGAKCAPHNDGEPICCSTDSAVPVMNNNEWNLLRGRSDLWHLFKPFDAATHEIVDTLDDSCTAVECKGARHCERDNRSLACRAFPFFPYVTRSNEFIGLSYYWDFEDRCWVISNLEHVEWSYVAEFSAAYEYLFKKDPQELDVFRDHSANMRRVFSRWERPIPLIGRAGGYFEILPHSGGMRQVRAEKFAKHAPYDNDDVSGE